MAWYEIVVIGILYACGLACLARAAVLLDVIGWPPWRKR